MDRKVLRFLGRRSAFLLAESLILLFILSLSFSLVVPAVWKWQKEHELDMAAETLASAIREVETLSKNDTEKLGNVNESWHFYCAPEKGLVSYHTRKGTTILHPKGVLPPSIVGSGQITLDFVKRSFAGKGSHYSMELWTKDRRHGRRVTVAMYTGRVRIVPLKGAL